MTSPKSPSSVVWANPLPLDPAKLAAEFQTTHAVLYPREPRSPRQYLAWWLRVHRRGDIVAGIFAPGLLAHLPRWWDKPLYNTNPKGEFVRHHHTPTPRNPGKAVWIGPGLRFAPREWVQVFTHILMPCGGVTILPRPNPVAVLTDTPGTPGATHLLRESRHPGESIFPCALETLRP